MGKISLVKFLFFNKATTAISQVIVRFYEQIISGMFALSILMPFEHSLECIILNQCKMNSKIFIIFFIISITLFLSSSILIPRIRQNTFRKEIQHLLRKQTIDTHQKNEILYILKDALACKDFFSKEGFWQFILSNIFNFAIVTIYFAIESMINYISHNSSHPIICIIFTAIFASCMTLEWLLDSIFTTRIMQTNDEYNKQNKDEIFDNKKQLILSIMGIMGRDSFRSSIGKVILEDVIDDIMAILSVKNRTQKTNEA